MAPTSLDPPSRDPHSTRAASPTLFQGGATFSKQWELTLTLALTLTQGGATFSKEWEAARLVLQGGLQRRVQRAKADR